MLRRSVLLAVLLFALGAISASAPAATSSAIERHVFRFVDHTRLAHFRNGVVRPRVLVTYVRYPHNSRAPLPLIVFGHGFATTPGIYARLLDAWARAGYGVAAPLFPVENANAPGGPDESDLINQPADISFVITRLLAESAESGSPLHGLIDPTRIAVSGQSDGGETALAVAYDKQFRDHRIRAAIILSGAQLGRQQLADLSQRPPLLATQGTNDRINLPSDTRAFFRVASRPKFLLSLLGAGHLPPYTTNATELAVVERVAIAFLDRYLKNGSLRRLIRAGSVSGLARLTADP